MRSNTDLIVLPEAEDDIRDIFKYTREVGEILKQMRMLI